MEITVIDFRKCGLLQDSVDVSHEDFRETGEKLYQAFAKSGFAYISNTGLPSELICEINDLADRFFTLPLDYKMKFCKKESLEMSYDPLGVLTTNLKRPFDYHEGLRIACNKKKCIWPEVERMEENISQFQEFCKTILFRVLKALGIGMKLKNADELCKAHEGIGTDENITCAKLIRYPSITNDIVLNENQIRIGEHTDFGSVSMLVQDDVGGLQIENSEGKFIDVPCVPGAILLNIADMMSFWSDGRLKSVVHRVIIDDEKKVKTRRTIGYFASLDNEVMLDKLKFEDFDEPPCKNKEILTAKEHMYKRYNENYHFS